MLIGSAISLITNGIGNTIHDRPFFQGAGMAALTGGIASFGIGQATMGMHGLDKIVNQTFGHGLLGGSMSGMSGGSFGSGFISGAFGSLAATGSGALLSNVNNSALYSIGMVGSGAIIGGIGSEIGGGEFWDGFRNGAISSSLNHWFHDAPPQGDKRISLYFDGRRLHIIDESTGRGIYNTNAYSGKGEGMNNPVFQNQENIGPLPEGNYSFTMDGIQTISARNKILGMFGRGEWSGGTRSWGNTRVWLTPSPYTNTYGRSGFTVHGGTTPGSRGCLDLVGNNNAFFNALQSVTGSQNVVIVRVRY